ncbi:MAG TPA: cytochrome b/b6 domain-containing protein [Burkholderiales bacterium]|nr:cytochrome b/b6 domain-containing protein [Burkholderiales bacterium]
MRVWDALVRAAHWTLVACVLAAWFTRDELHEWLGYAALAVVAVRIVWGFVGSRYARFARFVRPPAQTLAYTRALAAGRAPRHLGHNPLGAWMIVVLLATAALTAASGWLSVTDRYWGIAWVQDTHAALADALALLAIVHVAGIAYMSRLHRENLVAAMVSGRKRAPRAGDVLE